MDVADNAGKSGYTPDTLASRGVIPAKQLIPILQSLLNGLEALHRHKLIHRDIKPDNILFVNGVPVLGDVGLTSLSGEASLVGTPQFLPPEVLSGKHLPDEASDLFALGRVAYVALTGNNPNQYPQIPGDLHREAAPVIAFCRVASAKSATITACRGALQGRKSFRFHWKSVAATLLLILLAAVAIFFLWPRQVTFPTSFQPQAPDRISSPSTQAPTSRTFRLLTVDEYKVGLAALHAKYPAVPDTLAQQAQKRYEEVEEEHKTAMMKFFGAPDGAESIAQADEKRRNIAATDKLYQLADLTRRIEFSSANGFQSPDTDKLHRLDLNFAERQQIVNSLLQSKKIQK